VLVSVDWTPQVLAEALAMRADAVVSYHPPIFDPLKRLDAADPAQGALLGAARAGIALLSPHTAYDAVQGGMTDWLAEGLAGGAREVARVAALQPLRPACPRPSADRSTSETAPESALRPSPGEGAGRLLELRRDEPLSVIAARLRRFLGAPRVDAVVAGARHRRIAICPGAGASFLPDAVARGATLLVTGATTSSSRRAPWACPCCSPATRGPSAAACRGSHARCRLCLRDRRSPSRRATCRRSPTRSRGR
jgi:putative NIF3 family GTP cyclohydrolase 1 type 2